MPRLPDAVLTARLDRINELANDLALANGNDTPVTHALADAITRDVEAVRRALTRRTPSRRPSPRILIKKRAR
jgi:hypothetical protein